MNNYTPSLSLRPALARYASRLLIYIGRRRGLRLSSRLRKADLIDRLAHDLAQPANLEPALTHLSPAAHAALAAVVAAGGRVALRHLRSRFGALRPPRQTPGHYNPPAAGPPDLSPLEELRAWGLIFLDPAGREVYVPTEPLAWLVPHLAARNPPPNIAPATAQPQPDHSRALEYDLAALLALLHRHPLRLRHGRWLPPWFLKMWSQHSTIPPTRPTAAGERQTGRRRFLHYLAVAAGLVNEEWRMENGERNDDPSSFSIDNYQLSIVNYHAWLWLRAPAAEREQRLWDAWRQAEADLWRRFHLPGAPWLAAPDHLLAALWPALLDQPLFEPARFAADRLARRPELLDLAPPALIEPDAALAEAITQLLTGPLYWLGITTRTDTPSLWALSAAGRRRLAGQGANRDSEPAAGYHLDSHLPPEPRAGHLRLTPVGPHLPAPHHLAVVIDSADLDTPAPAGPGVYTLTAATVVDALQRGWSPANLVDSLSRLLTRPLTPAESLRLAQWAELAGQVEIRPAMLLETRSPAIITRLASNSRDRRLIRRTHSPRLIEIDPAQVDHLIRRLTRQEGVPPQVRGYGVVREYGVGSRDYGGKEKSKSQNQEKPQLPSNSINSTNSINSINSAEAAHLWLALRVYQSLRDVIDPPVRLPQTLLDKVAAMTGTIDLAGAEAAVSQTLDALRQAIDGRAAFPPWPEHGLPEETSRQAIEQALAAGRRLHLTYYAASTNRLTDRLVEPYRLEWRGDTPYLIAFCHHTQAERMFRLDRIRGINITDSDELKPLPPE